MSHPDNEDSPKKLKKLSSTRSTRFVSRRCESLSPCLALRSRAGVPRPMLPFPAFIPKTPDLSAIRHLVAQKIAGNADTGSFSRGCYTASNGMEDETGAPALEPTVARFARGRRGVVQHFGLGIAGLAAKA